VFKTYLALKGYCCSIYRLYKPRFVTCIAPTCEISVLAHELQSKFAENDREL